MDTEKVVIAIVVILSVVGLVLGLWKALNYVDTHRKWDPHCVCSQQTCFPAPDGGWRK